MTQAVHQHTSDAASAQQSPRSIDDLRARLVVAAAQYSYWDAEATAAHARSNLDDDPDYVSHIAKRGELGAEVQVLIRQIASIPAGTLGEATAQAVVLGDIIGDAHAHTSEHERKVALALSTRCIHSITQQLYRSTGLSSEHFGAEFFQPAHFDPFANPLPEPKPDALVELGNELRKACDISNEHSTTSPGSEALQRASDEAYAFLDHAVHAAGSQIATSAAGALVQAVALCRVTSLALDFVVMHHLAPDTEHTFRQALYRLPYALVRFLEMESGVDRERFGGEWIAVREADPFEPGARIQDSASAQPRGLSHVVDELREAAALLGEIGGDAAQRARALITKANAILLGEDEGDDVPATPAADEAPLFAALAEKCRLWAEVESMPEGSQRDALIEAVELCHLDETIAAAPLSTLAGIDAKLTWLLDPEDGIETGDYEYHPEGVRTVLDAVRRMIGDTAADAEVLQAEDKIAWYLADELPRLNAARALTNEKGEPEEQYQAAFSEMWETNHDARLIPVHSLAGATAKLRRVLCVETGISCGSRSDDDEAVAQALDVIERIIGKPTHRTAPITRWADRNDETDDFAL